MNLYLRFDKMAWNRTAVITTLNNFSSSIIVTILHALSRKRPTSRKNQKPFANLPKYNYINSEHEVHPNISNKHEIMPNWDELNKKICMLARDRANITLCRT